MKKLYKKYCEGKIKTANLEPLSRGQSHLLDVNH